MIQVIKCQEIQKERLTLQLQSMPWHLNPYTIINDSANVCVHLGGKLEIVVSHSFIQLCPIPNFLTDSRSEMGEKKFLKWYAE